MEEVNKAISDLINLLESKEKQKEDYEKCFKELYQYMLKIYESKFSELKKYTDECLAGLILKFEYDEKTYKEWIKYQFVVIFSILNDINDKILQDYSKDKKNQKDLFDFLNEFSSDLIIFLQEHGVFLLGSEKDFGHYKANVEQSLFVYIGIDTFLYKNIYSSALDKKFLLHLNIFSLRQAIELRCKEILGIYSVTNSSNKINKNFMGNRLIQIIKDHQAEIKLPLAMSIVENIYEWSNSYIHAGYKPPIWQVAFAHKISKDFFMPNKIEIKETFYKTLESIINAENAVKVLQFPKPLDGVKLY